MYQCMRSIHLRTMPMYGNMMFLVSNIMPAGAHHSTGSCNCSMSMCILSRALCITWLSNLHVVLWAPTWTSPTLVWMKPRSLAAGHVRHRHHACVQRTSPFKWLGASMPVVSSFVLWHFHLPWDAGQQHCATLVYCALPRMYCGTACNVAESGPTGSAPEAYIVPLQSLALPPFRPFQLL